MNAVPASSLLLVCSNVFRTFPWYAHLKELNTKPWTPGCRSGCELPSSVGFPGDLKPAWRMK
jgi:hypothetical protein